MKYAILEAGGKQFKAVAGATIDVDLMDVKPGESVTIEKVLLLVDGDAVTVGAPTIKGASIKTTVVDHIKGPKIDVFRYKPKKRVRAKTGHRQQYTQLKIEEIITE
jgi:large subunit ribosomal protein L21